MRDVTPVTNGRTHEQWEVVQYSVGAESAIITVIQCLKQGWQMPDSGANKSKLVRCHKNTEIFHS